MNLKTQLEKQTISDSCYICTYITSDEEHYILEINYLDGKFISEKTFPNNTYGIGRMEEIKELYKSENDILLHFGLI